MKESIKKIAIIGGGASGLTAAIKAAEQGFNVTILEKADRTGKKILKTGNGRCNLSNINVSKSFYNHPDFVTDVLEKIPCEKLLSFYKSIGLLTVKDTEGRIYPYSDSATSVLDVLRLRCMSLGVKEQVNTEVKDIKKQKDNTFLLDTNAAPFTADKVIVSVGGGSNLLKELGHNVINFEPILCPLKTDISKIKALSGLRSKCKVTLTRKGKEIYFESGEVLFRPYGLSGIVIFNLSRYAQKGDILHLDFLENLTSSEVKELLSSRINKGNDLLTGIFPKRIGEVLLKESNLTNAIKDFTLEVLDKTETNSAQVTRGGIDVNEVNSKTFESKKVKNLYITGEALDIDGACGGYNLHFAFASGLTAGESAADD